MIMSEGLIFDRNNKDHQIFVLQRYFSWADSFREDYLKNFPQYKHLLTDQFDPDPDYQQIEFFVSPAGRNLIFWCSMLWVVYEGWKEDCKMSDPIIDSLADEDKLKSLKLFRNATFHYQKDYFSDKMYGFMALPTSSDWLEALHAAFSTYLMEWQRGLSSSSEASPPRPTQ